MLAIQRQKMMIFLLRGGYNVHSTGLAFIAMWSRFNLNLYYIFGARPGAGDASIDQAKHVFKLVNAIFLALNLISLFFVPAFIEALRGPRNSFSLAIFTRAIAICFLLGMGIASRSSPNKTVGICGILFAVLIAAIDGLGYTAANSYFDYCAEWMAIVSTNAFGDK